MEKCFSYSELKKKKRRRVVTKALENPKRLPFTRPLHPHSFAAVSLSRRLSVQHIHQTNDLSPRRHRRLAGGHIGFRSKLGEAEPAVAAVEDEVRSRRLRVGAGSNIQPVPVVSGALRAASRSQLHLHQRHRHRPRRRQGPRRQSLLLGSRHSFLPQTTRAVPEAARRLAPILRRLSPLRPSLSRRSSSHSSHQPEGELMIINLFSEFF